MTVEPHPEAVAQQGDDEAGGEDRRLFHHSVRMAGSPGLVIAGPALSLATFDVTIPAYPFCQNMLNRHCEDGFSVE